MGGGYWEGIRKLTGLEPVLCTCNVEVNFLTRIHNNDSHSQQPPIRLHILLGSFER